IWNGGYPIVFVPGAVVTHHGRQTANRFPVRFELERHRSRFRYYHKHFGPGVLRQCRSAALTRIRIRQFGYSLARLFSHDNRLEQKLKVFRVAARWTRELDPIRFVEHGEEPSSAAVDWDAQP